MLMPPRREPEQSFSSRVFNSVTNRIQSAGRNLAKTLQGTYETSVDSLKENVGEPLWDNIFGSVNDDDINERVNDIKLDIAKNPVAIDLGVSDTKTSTPMALANTLGSTVSDPSISPDYMPAEDSFFSPSPDGVRIRDVVRELPRGLERTRDKINSFTEKYLTPVQEAEDNAQARYDELIEQGETRENALAKARSAAQETFVGSGLIASLDADVDDEGVIDVDLGTAVDPLGAIGFIRGVRSNLTRRARNSIKSLFDESEIKRVIMDDIPDIAENTAESMARRMKNLTTSRDIKRVNRDFELPIRKEIATNQANENSKQARELLTQLTNETRSDGTRFLLLRKGVPPDVADKFAGKLANASSKPEVRAVLEMVESANGMKMLGRLQSLENGVNTERDLVERVTDAIKDATRDRSALRAEQSAERAKRSGKIANIGRQQRGEQGFYSQLRALKGQLANDDPARNPVKLDQRDVDQLYEVIEAYPRMQPLDKISVKDGVRKLIRGDIPQESQLTKLGTIFGSEFEQAARGGRGKGWVEFAEELSLAPKMMTASLDATAYGVQLGILATSHPKLVARNLAKLPKWTISQRAADDFYASVPQHPLYSKMRDGGLRITIPSDTGGALSREEITASQLPKKIPFLGKVYELGERTYVPAVNKARMDYFTKLHNQFQEFYGRDLSQNELKEISTVVNDLTGGASLGRAETAARALNLAFFAPRLHYGMFKTFASPVTYAKQPTRIRLEQMKNLAKFSGTVATAASLINMYGEITGEDVEAGINPLKSDFGRVRIGNTRVNFGGRLTQFAAIAAQMATGRRITTGGNVVELDGEKFPFETRGDRILRTLRGKLSPTAGLAVDALVGEKFLGDPLTIGNVTRDLTVPLFARDLFKLYNEHELGTALFLSAGHMMGVTSTVYDTGEKTGGFEAWTQTDTVGTKSSSKRRFDSWSQGSNQESQRRFEQF